MPFLRVAGLKVGSGSWRVVKLKGYNVGMFWIYRLLSIFSIIIWAFPCGPGSPLICHKALGAGPVSAAIPNAKAV
jgi:hypothetical protein